jgi:hypothetical protein
MLPPKYLELGGSWPKPTLRLQSRIQEAKAFMAYS